MRPLIIEGCSATLHEPQAGFRRLVILVNTFGYEGAYTVRAWAALGEDLAHAGVALLRYDLPDQGDSCDLPPDADAASAWRDSVVAMVAWARDRFPGVEVGLCGYRLGALVAAMAASKTDDLLALSWIAPVVQGRTFVRELKLHTGLDASGAGLDQEGWWLSAASLQSLAGWSIQQLDPATAPPMLVIADNGIRALEAWLGSTSPESAPGRHQLHANDELALLRDEPHLVEVPESTFSDLVRWWTQPLPDTASSTDVESPRFALGAAEPQVLAFEGGTEQTLRFGPQRAWPGTWCIPAHPGTSRPSVLMLNTGGNPRSGHHRLSVKLARELARAGVASLRMDCRGIGESAPVLRRQYNALYRNADFVDVRDAIDQMQERGYPRPVVYGLCAGAYLAYQTALEDQRMSGLILANLYSFLYDRPMVKQLALPEEGRQESAVLIKPVETYFKVIRTRDFWKRLLSGQVNTRAVLIQVAGTYGHRLLLKLQGLIPGGIGLAPRVQQIQDRMRRLTDAKLPMLLFYGDHDPGLNDLNTVFGKDGKWLTRHPWVELDVIAQTDHTFNSARASAHVIQQVVRFLQR